MKEKSNNFELRPIEEADNESIKAIVLSTLEEHGAIGEGFASSDPELDDMFSAYQKRGYFYWVVTLDKKVVGGAGIGPLANASKGWCELQKMYFLAEARGKGFGTKLMDLCLKAARNMNYKYCYLETLYNMEDAQSLYRKVGFKSVGKRRGGTGHSGCPVFMELEL